MVSDLNMPLEIIGCPIIREADGLAKSSRNTYLSKEERSAALVLNRSLVAAKANLEVGERNTAKLKELIRSILEEEPLARVDYVEVVDAMNLESVETIDKSVLVAIAVYIGKTRLIDNFTYNKSH